MKKFDFEEDYEYFDRLFDSLGGINKNIHLFDFRTPIIKRKEFNKIRNDIFYILMEKKGNICELQLNENCTNNAEQVDHLIPLSSNDLNKELRNIKGVNGKKTPTQSYGSNNTKNLVLSCKKCNSFKKNHFPSNELLNKIFKSIIN